MACVWSCTVGIRDLAPSRLIIVDDGSARITYTARTHLQATTTKFDRVPPSPPPPPPASHAVPCSWIPWSRRRDGERTSRTYYDTNSANELYIAGSFGILLDYRMEILDCSWVWISVGRSNRSSYIYKHTLSIVSMTIINRCVSQELHFLYLLYIHPRFMLTCSYLLF